MRPDWPTVKRSTTQNIHTKRSALAPIRFRISARLLKGSLYPWKPVLWFDDHRRTSSRREENERRSVWGEDDADTNHSSCTYLLYRKLNETILPLPLSPLLPSSLRHSAHPSDDHQTPPLLCGPMLLVCSLSKNCTNEHRVLAIQCTSFPVVDQSPLDFSIHRRLVVD